MVGLHFLLLVIMYYLCTIKQYDSIKIIADLEFNAQEDAKALKKATKGLGTDNDDIIKIIGNRSNEQRRKIAKQYKSFYGEDLEEVLRKELSENFRDTVLALMMPLTDFYAQELHHAVSGIGTQEDVLVEILGTLNNEDVLAIADSYEKMYGKKIGDDIKEDTSGHFKSLCVSLLMGNRDESLKVKEDDVISDAIALNNAGKKRWGTNESEFNRILVNKSYEHLKLVFQEYKKMSSEDIEKTIYHEFSGDTYMGILSIVQIIKNKENYFAERLHSTMAGPGTKDRALIRILVTRSEVDMEGIKIAFNTSFQTNLKSRIESDTFGNYRKLLKKLIA